MGVHEENIWLVEKFQTLEPDCSAAKEVLSLLWEKNLKLIKWTVRKLTGFTESDDGFKDLVQQAYFGLYDAAQSYRSDREVEFSTWLTSRVKWGLCQYLKNNGCVVKVPPDMRKRLKDCMREKERLEAEKGDTVSYRDALQSLGFTESQISVTLSVFRKMQTVSLDAYTGEEKDTTLLDMLARDDDTEDSAISPVWQKELHESLDNALSALQDADRSLISRHYYHGVPLSKQAEEIGCTRQAMTNREQAAFKRIRIGKYGKELASFMPDTSHKARAERLIMEEREAINRLRLSNEERGLLVL